MANKPLISICIPTYNRHKLLKTCLDRIVSQDGFNTEAIEIVISDNASPDTTKSLVHDYQKKYPNIKYFRNKENVGASLNLFNAAEHASGEYIWFMGDDDIILEQGLKSVINSIKSCNDVILFQTNMVFGMSDTLIIQNGIDYFKKLIYNSKINNLMVFLIFFSMIIVKKDFFIKKLHEYKNQFPKKLGESYSHFYILVRCIHNQKIALLGNIIKGGNGKEEDKSYFKNNSKIRYNIVLKNGIDKIYEDNIFLNSIGITKKELDIYRYNFIKTYYLNKIANFFKKIGLYQPIEFFFKKVFFKHI